MQKAQRALRRNVRQFRKNRRVKPSQRHLTDAELMRAFRSAYVALANSSKKVEDGWASFKIVRDVDSQTWQQRVSAVASAAGAAVGPYARHGGNWTLRNAAYITHDVDPIANWEMSFNDPEQMPPQRILSSVDGAIASAQQDAAEAVERERGLTGLIASFLRWPSNLREAVGPGRGAQRSAATAIGVAGQVLVGALTTSLAGGLVAGAVALWRMVF